MEKKIPARKLILGSIGVSIALVIVALIFTLIGAMWGMVIFAIIALIGIDKVRRLLVEKHDINMLQFFLLTMLPPIVPFGLFVVYYFYMENNHWAELEGLLEFIILLAWFGVLTVSIGGTLVIAVIRKILSIKAK